MTQTEKIMEYMKTHDGITSMEAFRELNITRLASRIHDLRRAGVDIYNQKQVSVNREGKAVYYDRYKLR